MLQSKLRKILILALCFTLLISGTALAGEDGEPSQDGEREVKLVEEQNQAQIEEEGEAPDTPVSTENRDQEVENNDMIQKQSAVDKILFEDRIEEIRKQGIIITHTGPSDEYVEVGITPFNEDNAEYIYELLGRDGIKVKEGQQAEIFSTTVDSDEVVVDLVSADIEEDNVEADSKYSNILIYLVIGIVVLIGGFFILNRKLKSAK